MAIYLYMYRTECSLNMCSEHVLCAAMSVSLADAEATSSAIASQALSSRDSGQGSGACQGPAGSPRGGGPSETDHLDCGCRWAPEDPSRRSMVDIGSLVASMYHDTALPWQSR